MKNKKGNVVVIAIIVAIVAITAGVIGFLFAKKIQAPATEPAVTQPVAQKSVTQPADETVDWKTYTDNKNGFEIKYPKEWVLENTNYDYQNGVGLASAESAKIIAKNKSQELAYQYDIAVVVYDSISSLPGIKNYSIKNIDEYIQKNNVQYGVLHNPAKVTFAGKEAYSFVATGLTDNYTIIAKEGGKIYEMIFFKKSSDSELTIEQKKILSTFKFTDSAQANYFLIPEVGIKFKVDDEEFRNELTYEIEKNSYSDDVYIGIGTKTLVNKGGSTCKNGLGRLIKVYGDYTKDTKYLNLDGNNPWWETKKGLEEQGAVQFNEFFIWFQAPQDVCAATRELASEEFDKLLLASGKKLSQYIKNIELIK